MPEDGLKHSETDIQSRIDGVENCGVTKDLNFGEYFFIGPSEIQPRQSNSYSI